MKIQIIHNTFQYYTTSFWRNLACMMDYGRLGMRLENTSDALQEYYGNEVGKI